MERQRTERELALTEETRKREQAEIQRFMDRRLEIRRELRQVQHDLRRDIDRLTNAVVKLHVEDEAAERCRFENV